MSTCTACPYCGVGCGVTVSDKGEIAGDPTHPANFGRLCSKGSALGETIDLEGRLLAPMVQGAEASWDDALDLVADQFTQAIRAHGPDSVAFYVSGQLLTEDYYVANKLMKGYIGSANIDTNSRLCMASSVAGHKRAFGTDTVPGTYEDLELADLVVLVGSNLAWCHPVIHQRIAAAKRARPAMRVVNIDPRRTATSDLADLHLSIAPDGDSALFNLLLNHLAETGRIDSAYVAQHVSGAEAALEAARATARQSGPALTGLSDDEIAAFLDLWAGTEKVVTLYSQGVNQSIGGTDKVNAILNCHLATGRIGRPGMGPFSMTGQPNAMGGREVGGLANMLTCHLDIENPDHRAAVQDQWNSPTLCDKPGLKAVDLFEACAAGQIKALWIISTNPAVSLPDAAAVAQAISTVPFTVVSDIMARTDTGDLADVLLPATGWGEKSGTVTNSERRISRQRAFLPAPGQARPDWHILSDVAARMGWPEAFSYDGPAAIFREYAALSALGTRFGRDFDISGLAGLSDAAYDALAPVQWPVVAAAPQDESAGQGAGAGPNESAGETAGETASETADESLQKSGGRFFAKGGFYHPDGRARMLPITPVAMQAPVARATPAPDPAGTPSAPGLLRLNSGRIRDQWHTMTRTGKSARLSQHLAEPFVELHPEDAFARGLRDADLVELSSPHGTAILRVLISSKAQRGSLFAPMHWTAQFAPTARTNRLVPPVVDPVSGQPALKGGMVTLKRYEAAWYGYVVTRARITPEGLGPIAPYRALARISTGAQAAPHGGWQAELAGHTAPKDWEETLRQVTGLHQAEASRLSDQSTGMNRIALTREGRIEALLFTARQPVALSRAHARRLIGTDTRSDLALAGAPADGKSDPGAIVCSCLNVGVNTLRAAISAGACDVDALGQATQAGTNCGSCRPELAALLAATPRRVAAE